MDAQTNRSSVDGSTGASIATLAAVVFVTLSSLDAQERPAPLPSDHRAAPVDVSLCELMANPTQFDEVRVRIRGQVHHAFEEFTLVDPACEGVPLLPGVWLEYGGDEPTTAVFCCGDHRKRQSGGLQGGPAPLTRDDALVRFVDRLNARRLGTPNGDGCRDRECAFYDVNATLIGTFRAAQVHESDISGFGHMGVFHLLTIEQVQDVVAERTAVPAGGTYRCSIERKAAEPTLEARLLALAREELGADSDSQPGVTETLFSVIASQWNAVLPPGQASYVWTGDGSAQRREWRSADLQLSYSITRPDPEVPVAHGQVFLEREQCEAVTPPAPPDSVVTCAEDEFGPRLPYEPFLVNDSVTGPLTLAGPVAMRQFFTSRHVELGPGLQIECREFGSIVAEGLEFGQCFWTSPDGLQSADAAFSRAAHPGQAETTWGVVRASATTCRVGH